MLTCTLCNVRDISHGFATCKECHVFMTKHVADHMLISAAAEFQPVYNKHREGLARVGVHIPETLRAFSLTFVPDRKTAKNIGAYLSNYEVVTGACEMPSGKLLWYWTTTENERRDAPEPLVDRLVTCTAELKVLDAMSAVAVRYA